MARRNNPVVAVLDGNRPEALGLRELILRVKPKAHVLIYHHPSEFFGEDSDGIDILCIEESALVLLGDKFRNKKYQIIPIVRRERNVEEALSSAEGEITVLCSEWREETLRKHISEAFDRNQEKRSLENEKGLSRRELDVLKEVARGYTNKEIADKLDISMNTVMTHRKNITAKLNIKTVSGLTFYALMNNLITGDEMENKGTE